MTESVRRRRIVVVFAAALLSMVVVGLIFVFQHRATESAKVVLPRLPSDVDSVVRGFRYHHGDSEREIMIKGDKIVRRGKKFFGMRSTLVKENYFQHVTGTLKWRKSRVTFSAARAEWALNFDMPLILEEDVTLDVKGVRVENVLFATIDCRKGIVETRGSEHRVYTLN